MSLKICANVVLVSNSLDPDEISSYSASRPDPSCLQIYDIIVAIGGLSLELQ